MPQTRSIVTPIFRASYVNLFEPRESESGAFTYSLTMIFEPDADLSELKAIIREAINDKWEGKPPTGLRNPIRRGEEKSDTYDRGFNLEEHPYYADKIIVATSCYTSKSKEGLFNPLTKPGIVGPNPKIPFEATPATIYSGMYARAKVAAYAYEHKKGGKGVSIALQHVQKCYDGEPLGVCMGRPEDAFTVFDVPDPGSNEDLLGI